MPDNSQKPRVVFDFIRSPLKRLTDVKSGKAPGESFLGYIQLKERGWPVSASYDRWSGTFGSLRQKLVFKLEIPSFQMIKHWYNADIIIVETRISLVLAIIAKLLGKKIVFLDAMCEEVPKRLWRQLIIKLSLRMADACICLSSSQAKHWAEQLNISKDIFTTIFYGVDIDFYKLPSTSISNKPIKPYLLAVGRDPGRDFTTLVSAADELGWDLKLVTQHYLVPEGVKNNPNVQILDGLSYEDLFNVYKNATTVVVPVKCNTTYMSGIRATMEAMLIGVPVVASRTSGMEEYFSDGEELIYFEPENHKALVGALLKIYEDKDLRDALISRARGGIIHSYSVSNYTDSLEKFLLSL